EEVWHENVLEWESSNVSCRVLNGGVGGRVSLNKVCQVLAKISGNQLEVKHEPNREGDIRDSQADISAGRELLGYDPRVDFEEGLRRTFEWYKMARAKASKSEQEHPQPVQAK